MIPFIQVIPRTIYAGHGRSWTTAVALPGQSALFLGIRFKGRRLMLSIETPHESWFRPMRKIVELPEDIELVDSFPVSRGNGDEPQDVTGVWNCRLLAFLAKAHVQAFPEEGAGFNEDMRERGVGQRRWIRWLQAPKRVWLENWGPAPDDSWSVLP